MKVRLGIDLGGTSAKIALVSTANKILKLVEVESAGFPNPSDLVEKMANATKKLLNSHKLTHAGVGVAGDIDSKKGVVRVSPNLGWKNVPLGPLLTKKLKSRVIVENDANAAAWGFYKTQTPKSVQNIIVMTLGTGVGGGIILNGKLISGATGSAGEVGHMTIDEKGPLCNCGNNGCLETYVGGPHIVGKVLSALNSGQTSSLQKLFQVDPHQITAQHISEAARNGDAYALSIWTDVANALAIAVGNLIYTLNPQWIVFTGGIAQTKDLILDPLKKKLKARAFQTPIQAATIKVASDAPHIGVLGSSLL